jgi:hypothetical protein
MPPEQLEIFTPVARSIEFLGQIRAFDRHGKQTVEQTEHGIPFFYGEFWTPRQRQGHSLHEISYRACFKPQLPEFFISRLSAPGETIYDPFMGRGTTPLQASLMGRRAIGVDINPLSTYLTKPRLSPPTIDGIRKRLGEVPWGINCTYRDDLLAFFHPETLREICNLRNWLIQKQADGRLDPVDEWIRMVALNRLTGHSPGFFSVYTMPPNQAVSVESQRKINEKRGQTPPRRDVTEIILKKSRSLLSDGHPPSGLCHSLFTGSADSTPFIGNKEVDLIITSPPFLDVVQYAADNWLRCWFADIDPAKVDIAIHKSEQSWMRFMATCFTEFGRVTKRGGHVAFEVGEVRGGSVRLEELVLQSIRCRPWEPVAVLINVQEFTKTANCWGISNNKKGTNTNRIVLLRRSHE